MRLVILFGPHAVGKMTVGQALAKETGMKLFHNHMTIEGICDLFASLPAERARLTQLFREEVFRSFLKTDEPGLIFTFMWAFDMQSDWDYLAHVQAMYEEAGAEVDFVELSADFDCRILRNKTENRLLNKPSKRDLTTSEALFRRLEERHRLNSLPGGVQKAHYLSLNNTNMQPEEAARRIIAAFNISRVNPQETQGKNS